MKVSNEEKDILIINKGERKIIGRKLRKNNEDQTNPFKFSDDLMSANHFEIISEGDIFYVEDKNSKNGTWRTLFNRKEKHLLNKTYRYGDAFKVKLGF